MSEDSGGLHVCTHMIHRTFDRRSKRLDAQLARFQREVQEIERKIFPAVLVTRSRHDGHFLHVTVLAAVHASSALVSANSVEAWRLPAQC